MPKGKAPLITRIRARARKLLGNSRGQSTTEYILILSVVVMIAMKFKTNISKQIEEATITVGGNIQNVLTNP